MDRLRTPGRPRPLRARDRAARLRGAVVGALVGAAVLAPAAPAAGQTDRDRLVERIGGGYLEAVLAAEAVTGGVGLAVSGGNEFPGAASTLGKRFGSTPRVAAALRLSVVGVDLPTRGALEAAGSSSSWLTSLHGAVAVSLFDGFRPRPTVGGVLGVDVLATGSLVFLPSGGGFDGGAAALGYGVRVGLVRESFSLPGVTVSAVRRHGGGVEWSGADGGSPGVVVLDGTTTTSLRGTVGREFEALGIQAGLGWDRVSADGSLRDGPGAPVTFDDFKTERWIFFGGLTRTWLVTQIHAEAGYASGYDARPVEAPAGFDPTAGGLLASLTFRILF